MQVDPSLAHKELLPIIPSYIGLSTKLNTKTPNYNAWAYRGVLSTPLRVVKSSPFLERALI